MINRRMKFVDVYGTQKEGGIFKPTETPVLLKSVSMAISTLTGQSAQYNAVNVADSTHVGLTPDKTLEKGLEVHDGNDVYKIAQVFLEKVVPDNGK